MKQPTPAAPARDLPLDDHSALLYLDASPLKPTAPELRDCRAAWAGVPAGARLDGTAMVFLHGNNNYVTIGADGKGRVPDWAVDDVSKAGAAGKPPAPIVYQLDRFDAKRTGRAPLLLVPEDAVHRTGAFWANEPAGQYADPAQMGKLIDECQTRLAALRRPDGGAPYLATTMPSERMRRVCVSGHSGAGLPMQEAARSTVILPGAGGVPADLWLLDCTYWSNVAGFAEFCARWSAAGRLKPGDPRSGRFVCIYRPKTQTEAVADDLRTQIARGLGVDPATLVQDDIAPNGKDGRRNPATAIERDGSVGGPFPANPDAARQHSDALSPEFDGLDGYLTPTPPSCYNLPYEWQRIPDSNRPNPRLFRRLHHAEFSRLLPDDRGADRRELPRTRHQSHQRRNRRQQDSRPAEPC